MQADIIQGMGAVSAAGVGIEALRACLRSGQTALAPMTRFPARSGPVPAGLCAGEPPPAKRALDPEWAARLGLRFGEAAAREALGDRDPAPMALVVGTNLEDHPVRLDALAAALAHRLGIGGPVVVCSTACASSTTALGHARALLDEGAVTQVLVGGLDVVTPRLHAGFDQLGAVSRAPCVPFDERLGLSLGDGAAFLLIERTTPAPGDTALLGWGLAADAHHPTAPAPDGRGVTAALRRALADAGLRPADVDYVNAHGTATAANDAAEWAGIARALGPDLPCSSTKSVLGHTQGAAGALELVSVLLCRADGTIPTTVGFEAPRPGAPPDPVADPVPRVAPCETVASVSLGFGGANAAVLVGAPRARRRAVRPVYVGGLGLVAPEPGERRIAPGTLRAELRGVDPRELDPASRFALAAIARAFQHRDRPPDRQERHATGIILGQPMVSPDRLRRLDARIEAHGVDSMSAILFTRALQVVTAGACAIQHGLRGPLDVVVGADVAGLAAVAHAAWLLSRDPGLRGMLAGGVHEAVPDDPWEGAGIVGLQAEPTGVLLAGWARARTVQTARRRAQQMAGADTPGWEPGPAGADTGAGMRALAHARHAIATGETAVATVSAAGAGGLACALVLRGASGMRPVERL
jgi:3-oxoacyl-[acyl-carrier-protein] synthase II